MSVTTASVRVDKNFMNDINSVIDSPRPGQAHQVVTPVAIAAVEIIAIKIAA
jgi:hypothetical protein